MLNTKTYVSDYSDRPLLDKRRVKRGAMSLDEVFYVVHLVSQGDKTWHRASLIAADVNDVFLDGLCEGLSDIERTVANELNYSGKINGINPESLLVHPIFIRNLNADHPDLIKALEITRISRDLSHLISTKPDLMRYVVVGIASGKNKADAPIFTDVKAENAVVAIERVTVGVQMQMDCNFRPLFSTIQAPVTSEMFARYAASAKHIRDFVIVTPTSGTMLH